MAPFFNPSTIDKKDSLAILTDHGLPHKGWWAKYPVRAIEEIHKMASNTNATIKYEDDSIIWEEWIKTNFNTHYLIEIETQGFPFKMPTVKILEPEIIPSLDFHMYEDKTLCLMHPSDHSSKNSVLHYRNQAAAWAFAHSVYTHTGKFAAGERHH